MLNKKVLFIGLIIGTVASTLSGCTYTSDSSSVSAASVAEEAENALEAEVGSRPVISCGNDTVTLSEGLELSCELHAPGYEDIIYDTTVVISEVEGTKYHINVQVDKEPK